MYISIYLYVLKHFYQSAVFLYSLKKKKKMKKNIEYDKMNYISRIILRYCVLEFRTLN